MIDIRLTETGDFRKTEEITREAFWNIHGPGCDEHYLLRKMRSHDDFIRGLDYSAWIGEEIVGNIVYTKSVIISSDGESVDTLTFGPVAVLPRYQKQGVGSMLIGRTFELVQSEFDSPAVIIFGFPHDYVRYGFVNGYRHNIGIDYGSYPSSLLVRVFDEGRIAGRKWKYMESGVYEIGREGFEEYDSTFPEKRKEWKPSQEEFWIASHSFIET